MSIVDTLGPAISARLPRAVDAVRPERAGRVDAVVGLGIRVTGLALGVGDAVRITREGRTDVLAEVVAVEGTDAATCLPFGECTGIRAGARTVSLGGPLRCDVGAGLLGRVLDGLGRPVDGLPAPQGLTSVTVDGEPPDALRRSRVDTPLALGVRALDAFTPCGRGQRIGLFAGSGVGKSSLLSMIARGTDAEVNVLALVGERGREVREFLDNDLGPEGLARSVVVVATSDQPPLVRLRAAFTATRIAEAFRDEGRDVLLMMDSLTRCAMAQREVGLSAGEPPATRGYPPSVFALMPRLLERAGTAERGSITGIYTVLVEGDDHNEPIADTARSILDGHIVLNRRLATSGHFPSVDVLESVSRVTGAVTTSEQRQAVDSIRALMAAYRDARDLVDIGAYVSGSNPTVDRALALWPQVEAFLRQPIAEVSPLDDTWSRLIALATQP